MLPPAPGLFPPPPDWPQTSCSRLLTRRAVISVEPPGVNGTTTRTGFTGQSAPEAREIKRDGAAMAAVARPTKPRRFSMGALPPDVTARLPQVVVFFRSLGTSLSKINAARRVRQRTIAAAYVAGPIPRLRRCPWRRE